MTTSSPLLIALVGLPVKGWLLKSLSRGEFDSIKPWFCELYPNLMGSYYGGRPTKESGYTIYKYMMTTVKGSGGSPLEAIQDALRELDKSDAKEVYEDFFEALEEWLDAARAFGNRG